MKLQLQVFAYLYILEFTVANDVVEFHIEQAQEKKPCTYFEGRRFAGPELGLVNCSWYTQNACCRRTEVTSVFNSMFSLFGATTDCRNRLNYMMCFFCDPNQMIWYNKDLDRKVHVCSEFCNDVYDHCLGAIYNGTRIGTEYRNGSSFCEAENFHVIPGKERCFKFDPTVFGQAVVSTSQLKLTALMLAVLWIIWKYF